MRAHCLCVDAPQPRTDDDSRPERLHSDPGNEAALTREPESGPLHLAERVEVLGPLKVNTTFIGRRGYALEWHAEPGAYEVLFEGHGERMLVSPAHLIRSHTMDYSGPFLFHRLPEVRDCPRRAKHTAPSPAHPHSLPKDSAPLIARAEPCIACACCGRT